MNNNNCDGSQDSEYFYEMEAEYFGFTPFQFLDSIGEIVVKSVFSMFDRAPTNLSSLMNFLNKPQLDAGLGQWTALVESNFARNYELFESYVIKNVLVVPDAFILPHHRQFKGISELESAKFDEIDNELEQLSSRLQEARALDAYLDAEEVKLKEEEEFLNKLESQLDTLKENLISNNIESFEQFTRSIPDKLSSLQKIVLETIENSRNINSMEAEDNSLEQQRWNLERRFQNTISSDQILEYERELQFCRQIVSLEEISALQRSI